MIRLLIPALVLVTCALPAQQDQLGSEGLLSQIEREYRKKLHGPWVVRVRSGNADPVAPSKVFIDRCLFAAKQHAGKDEAVPFLVWIVRNATDEGKSVVVALDTLLSAHTESPAWTEVLDVLLGTEKLIGAAQVESVLARVSKENPHPEVKARAQFAIAERSLAAMQNERTSSWIRARVGPAGRTCWEVASRSGNSGSPTSSRETTS